eukprot:5933969-Prymnesium_polylepis.1
MLSGNAQRAPRLRACPPVSQRGGAAARGCFAITGGLGGLGLRAAVLLVDLGSYVTLLSRSGHVVRGEQALEAPLQRLGGAAKAVACDGADASDNRAAQYQPLVGVLHAAGVGDEGLLAEVAAHRVRWMYAPKSFGAWHISCTSAAASLEVLMLFSSVGS